MTLKEQIIADEHYLPYIQQVVEEDAILAIGSNSKIFREFLEYIPPDKRDFAYASGKWTIKETLQHIIDSDRVFAYRALCFSRKDPGPLKKYDQDAWGSHAEAAGRNWNELVEEFTIVRRSVDILFRSFTVDQWLFAGLVDNRLLNAIAIAFVIPGHAYHHMGIIRERYLSSNKTWEEGL